MGDTAIDLKFLPLFATTVGFALLYHIVTRLLLSPLRAIPTARTDWRTWTYKWIYKEPTPPQLLEWANKTPNNGLLRYYGIGGKTRILLTKPETVREVMVTKRYEAYGRSTSGTQLVEMLFGHGVLTSEGDAHRKQKRAMAPAFTRSVVASLCPMFFSKAHELVDTLNSEIKASSASGGAADIELVEWTSRAALDVIGVAVWGKDFNALAQPHSDFVVEYERIFRPGTAKSRRQARWIYAASYIVPMTWIRRLYPCDFFQEKAAGGRSIRQACNMAIGAKRAGSAGGDAASKDVLSRAMALDAFQDSELMGQMMNLLAAGHGTVSLTVTWLLYFLARNPNVQSRLREEIRSALPSVSADREPSADRDTFAALPYLADCIRETLRVVPIVPLLRRETTKKTTIAGNVVPAGTGVMCAPWVTNMLEEEWGADAHVFDPDRWSRGGRGLQDASRSGSTYSYIPFSCGPRACIGEGFAKAEISALVAALVGAFEVELPDNPKPVNILWGLTATPVGLHLRLRSVGVRC